MASPLTLSPDEFKKLYGDITAPDSDVLLSLTPEEFNQRYNGKSAQQIEQPKPISLAEKAFKSFGAASAGVIGEPAAAAIDILGGVDTAAAIRKRLGEVQAGVQREVPELGKEFKFEDLQDPSFYATKGVSVLPALIALVGTGAGAGGVGARGAVGLASRLGAGAKGLKAAKAIGEIGTSALVSRTLEGALEASGTYNQLLNEGADRENAADAAAKVFRNNYALTGMDAAQYAAATLKLPPALSKGLVKWAANAIKLGVASGSEGLEELYQGYVAKSAQEYAKGMSSIDGLDAKEFWNYATRAPLWQQEEFVIGSLFGLGFQVGEGALAKYGKTEEELRQAIKRNPQEVIQTLKGQADEQRADNATREQVAQQAFGKKFDDLTDEQKQKIVDKAAEAKTAEEDALIDDTLQGVTEQAEPLEEISQKVYKQPYAELPLPQRQALKKRYQTLVEKAQAKKIDDAIAEKVGLKKPKTEKPEKEKAQPPVAARATTASTAADRIAPATEPVALKEPEVVTPKAESSPSQPTVAPSPVSARAGEEPQPSKAAVVENPTHKEFDRAFETFQEVAAKQTGKPVPEQSAAIAEELRARNVNPVIIDELTNPRRALKPRNPEAERSATSRPERIARAVEPHELKPKVDAVAQANVDFRNKEAALLKAREEIKAEIEARGGEVVVDTGTGAMTITLKPGRAKISEADQALIEKLRAEAADAGAYSLATVGQGFEVSATPERIAEAESLPKGDFKARALEFLRRNAEAKAAEKVFKQAKEDARNDLVDYYLAERVAGKETPPALLGRAKDGTKVEVMARRVRSAAEPDLAVGGRDFPKEIAEAKQKAKELATETGEPFIEARKAGEKKVTQAKERGAFVAEQSEGYQPNRPGDFLFNPNAVFEQKPYEPNYKKRTDATPRTDRLAKEIVNDLGKNRKRGRVYLANAIDASARETGQIGLVGQEVKTTDDLAVVGQVARDPRVEHLRYVLVKDGKSIGSYVVGSRLPSATAAFPYASTKEGIAWLNGLMKETGADGYFMLHNHPSGEVDTSGKEDLDVTETVSSGVDGFKGHVIIDSNVYATITREKDGSLKKQIKQKFFGEDKLLVPSLDHPLIGRKAEDANDLMAIGKSVQAPEGWATLVGATPDSRIRGIAEVEEALLQTKGKRRAAVIRKFARDTGSANVFLVADQKFFDANKDTLMKAVELGFITDAVSNEGDSIHSQFPKLRNENVFFGKKIEAGRVVKEGEAKKQAWEMTFDELIENQRKFNQSKVDSAKKELASIEAEARNSPIQGNLTRRKDFSDLKRSKSFSEKHFERYRLASDTISKYEAILKSMDEADTIQRVREFHKSAVEKAISKGLPVPEKVLSEYLGESKLAAASEKEKKLSRLLPPESNESAPVTSGKRKHLRGKSFFEKTPPAGWSESDLVQSTKGAQEIPDTIPDKEEPAIVRESESTYGKAGLNRDQFLDLGKMVNDFLQSKEQVAKLSKAEREEFAEILDVLKDYKELSEKADLSPSEKVLLKYAIRDIESTEGKRVIEKVQAALRENKPIEAGWLDKIAEWTASMYLWRLASAGTSLGSNLFRQLLKYPELKLAAWFNQGVARQTRVERTRFSEEAEKDFRDAWTGGEFKKAAQKALDIMQEKPDAAEESKFFEREKVKRKSIGGKKGTVIRAGLNAQAAIDVLFRQPATTAAISRHSFREAAKTSKNRVEQAKKANAIAQNVRRLKALKDAKQEVPEYLEKFEPILAKAEADAEAQTFQSELDGFLKHVSEIRRYPLARIFVPFFNTRMNVLLQAYARTPLSAFGKEFRDLGAKALNKKLTAEEAGRLSDRMAEITLGTAAFLVTTAAIYGLSDDDEELITGDFDEKTIGDKPAGWLPNAARVGDTYVSMKGFEPYATIFTAFGNAASGKKSLPRNAAEALAKAAFSNPMTDELFDIMGSLKDGDADKFFVDMVFGAATPGLLQDISKIVDPTIRQKEGLEDRFKSKIGIPGVSSTLPEKIDVFGEDLEPQTSGEKALKTLTGVSISKSKEDPARREIRKLGLKHNLNTITHQGVQLEPWEVLALNKSIGDEYHKTVLKLLQNPTYLSADKEARKAKLRAVRKGLIDRQKAILERTPYFMARERVADAQKETRERVKEKLEE